MAHSRFHGKVIWITGASSGIGEALAKRFAMAGSRLMVGLRSNNPLYDATMELKIVCTLTEAQLKERRRTALDSLRRVAIDVLPLPLGYAYRFNATSEVLEQLTKLVDLERQCCQFLTFKVIVEPGRAPIRLEVTGPQDAKPIIEDFFGGGLSEAST